MKIKINSFYSLQAIFISGFLGLIYLQVFAIPSLRGKSEIVAFVGDSVEYQERARTKSTAELLPFGYNPKGLLYGYSLNFFGITMVGKIAQRLNNKHYEYIVFALNFFLLILTIKNCQDIFKFYRSPNYAVFLFLFFCNPLVIANLVSLNKEIWGLCFIISFLRNRIYKAHVRYFLVMLFSFFIRDVFFFTGVLFFLMTTLKIKRLFFLIIISIIAPFMIPESMVHYSIRAGQRSAMLMDFFANIQSYPFGYLFTYFPKLIINMYTGLYPPRWADFSFHDIYGFFSLISSVTFFLCSLIIVYKIILLRRIRKNSILISIFCAFTFLHCLISYSVHRYYFPLYPIVVILALLNFTKTNSKAAKTYDDWNFKPQVIGLAR